MAIPLLLSAGARAVGGQLVKSAGKKIVASKVLGKKKGKETESKQQSKRKGSSALVPYAQNAQKPGALTVSEVETAKKSSAPKNQNPYITITKELRSIEKILKKTLSSDKKYLLRKKKITERQLRDRKEKERETKKTLAASFAGKMGLTKLKDSLMNFIGNILLGKLVSFLIDNYETVSKVIKFLTGTFDFLSTLAGTVFNGIVTVISSAYDINDKIREKIKEIGGEDLQKTYDGFTDAFTKVANTALILLTAYLGLGGKSPLKLPNSKPKGKLPQTKAPGGKKVPVKSKVPIKQGAKTRSAQSAKITKRLISKPARVPATVGGGSGSTPGSTPGSTSNVTPGRTITPDYLNIAKTRYKFYKSMGVDRIFTFKAEMNGLLQQLSGDLVKELPQEQLEASLSALRQIAKENISKNIEFKELYKELGEEGFKDIDSFSKPAKRITIDVTKATEALEKNVIREGLDEPPSIKKILKDSASKGTGFKFRPGPGIIRFAKELGIGFLLEYAADKLIKDPFNRFLVNNSINRFFEKDAKTRDKVIKGTIKIIKEERAYQDTVVFRLDQAKSFLTMGETRSEMNMRFHKAVMSGIITQADKLGADINITQQQINDIFLEEIEADKKKREQEKLSNKDLVNPQTSLVPRPLGDSVLPSIRPGDATRRDNHNFGYDLPPTNTIPGQNYGDMREDGARRHAGQDFDISGASATFASQLGGVVIFSGNVGGGYGNVVDIYNKELNVTERIAEAAHILPEVKVGARINPGQIVVKGESNTGVIHYEIRKGRAGSSGSFSGTIDPLRFLEKNVPKGKSKVNPDIELTSSLSPTGGNLNLGSQTNKLNNDTLRVKADYEQQGPKVVTLIQPVHIIQNRDTSSQNITFPSLYT